MKHCTVDLIPKSHAGIVDQKLKIYLVCMASTIARGESRLMRGMISRSHLRMDFVCPHHNNIICKFIVKATVRKSLYVFGVTIERCQLPCITIIIMVTSNNNY